ncbi:hypothetical protein ACE5D9_03260 [Rickettsia sp. 2024-CO-Wats]|uniref:hypothetical protein n=1 Tax=unclassified Rickettsia TaxID=114295 RepID=UPI00370D2BDD
MTEEAIIDNEIMIDILYENRILPLISNISYIQAYVMNGYCIYEDVHGNTITAINDLKILFSNNIFRSIMLIKRYYFYKLLEKNFAHLTSIKAKYALEFKVGPIIAKNINYTNKIIILFVVFIATLIYLPVLFHVANNISYCLHNILKSLLFIRAVRESPSVGLHGLKSVFGVIPWFDHGIQKIIKNTNILVFLTGSRDQAAG